MRNQDIHEAFEKSGVKKWVVAEKLGIADTTFSRKLRREFKKGEKEKVLQAIEEAERENKEDK